MKLYYAPGACSLATHIALSESGLAYDTDRVAMQTRETAGGKVLSQVNPKNKVPALDIGDGDILTENAVLLQYVADQPGSAVALPQGKARYRLMEWLNFIATELHKGFGPLFNRAAPDEIRTAARQNLDKQFKYVEDRLGDAYLTGDQFGVADAYLFTMLNWAKRMELEVGPKLQAYFDRVRARPGVQRALETEGLA